MTIKKKLIFFLLIIVFIFCVIAFKMTSIRYFKRYDVNVPPISDSNYLGVTDLKFLYIFQDRNEKRALELLLENMIFDSHMSNGINEKYSATISNNDFEMLNPNKTGTDNFKIIDTKLYCLCNENKAIVFFSKECFVNSDNIIECVIDTTIPPFDRVYLEKVNDEWKVVSIFQPA